MDGWHKLKATYAREKFVGILKDDFKYKYRVEEQEDGSVKVTYFEYYLTDIEKPPVLITVEKNIPASTFSCCYNADFIDSIVNLLRESIAKDVIKFKQNKCR